MISNIDKKFCFNNEKLKYEEQKSSQTNISWSSSDSDDEPNTFFQLKKLKTKYNNSSLNWIKPAVTETFLENKQRSPDESPVISSCAAQEMSPVLSESTSSEVANESSPVIGKRRLLKRMRSKFKKSSKLKFESSPDIFESQSSLIIENDSPEFLVSNGDISPIKSLDIHDISSQKSTQTDLQRSLESIYPFPSQHSSQITRYDSTESNNSNNSLYYQPGSKRKRYKKDGLAFQLQNVLHLKKSKNSIWKHELYMKRVSNVEGMIQFLVLKVKKEYGKVVLNCSEIVKKTERVVFSDSLLSAEHENFMLVLISGTENINFMERNTYKLYPPYEAKMVLYNNSKEVICYYNVSKIIS